MSCDFYRTEQRKAGKDYVCQLCGKAIRKGREHVYESGKYDGEIFSNRRHIHCDALLDSFWAIAPMDEWDEQEVYEYVREVCAACPLWHDDSCVESPYWCPVVIEKLVEGNARTAAIISIQENREDKA